MNIKENKYFSNGVLMVNTYTSTMYDYYMLQFNAFYYNTNILYISISFEENKDPVLKMWVDDGGYHKSPLTLKAMKRVLDMVYEYLKYDAGNKFINKSNHIVLQFIQNVFDTYRKYYRTSGKSATQYNIVLFDKNYETEIYYN